MKHFLYIFLLVMFGWIPIYAQTLNKTVTWDSKSLLFDGKRVIPVMGEIHYSRIPENEWRHELQKMKAGGVTMVANYVFWNHVEEEKGIFDWSKQRSLRHFLELCKEESLPVILRIGPFCHGEVRCGGIPDWVLKEGVPLRTTDPTFLYYVSALYRQIFTQAQGLLWKDGGPVIACQFDNEYGGESAYLMALKHIAQEVGFDLPFYTRTGWPELKTPIPYGEMIPLYGDYADGFWDRSIEETTGDYWKAFNFKSFRSSSAIASEQLKQGNGKVTEGDELYPYFTCELGGGMMTSYHRRVYIYPQDAYALAIVKLGSGSNLLGYYMYHGGTNPEGLTYLNEMQRTAYTNWNDLPVKTYDFQAPLGEFGQKNPHYYMLRKLHLFLQDYGNILAPMEAFFPQADKVQRKGIDSYLRWSYRQKDNSAFVFVNNYERLQNITDKKHVQFEVCGVKFPQKSMTIPAGTSCIFPVNIDGIQYATAQLIAKRNGNIYLEQVKGIPTEIAIDGKILNNVKAKGIDTPVYENIYLLKSSDAECLFLSKENMPQVKSAVSVAVYKTQEAGAPRKITIGVAGVAEEPVDADFRQAAIYKVEIPSVKGLLSIRYQGDCARLYADGKLIADNFYNGREFLYGLWRLPQATRQLELRILPIQSDMPVYFPREADTTPGEKVISCELYE